MIIIGYGVGNTCGSRGARRTWKQWYERVGMRKCRMFLAPLLLEVPILYQPGISWNRWDGRGEKRR
jgi:hypothetical protein